MPTVMACMRDAFQTALAADHCIASSICLLPPHVQPAAVCLKTSHHQHLDSAVAAHGALSVTARECAAAPPPPNPMSVHVRRRYAAAGFTGLPT